jgi:hypothetical protein
MEAEKQWEMDGETQRNNKAKDPKELPPRNRSPRLFKSNYHP